MLNVEMSVEMSVEKSVEIVVGINKVLTNRLRMKETVGTLLFKKESDDKPASLVLIYWNILLYYNIISQVTDQA